MSKLLDLKEWVTIEEAVNYLSKALEENITEADIYKLALHDKLILSVYFTHQQYFQYGYLEPIDNEKHFKVGPRLPDMTEDIIITADNTLILPDEKEVIAFKNSMNEPITSSGCFDIVNLLNGAIIIESCYHQLKTGASTDLIHMDGLLLKSPNDNTYYRLLTKFVDTLDCKEFYPVIGFNEYSAIVVRVKVLKDFVKKINNPNEEVKSELSTKEKEMLYKIIRILLLETDLLQHASITKNSEIKGHNTIAKILINNIGDKVKNLPSQRTIADVLKEAMLDLKPEDFNKE